MLSVFVFAHTPRVGRNRREVTTKRRKITKNNNDKTICTKIILFLFLFFMNV